MGLILEQFFVWWSYDANLEHQCVQNVLLKG